MIKKEKARIDKGRTSFLFKLGIVLMLASFLRWAAVPFIFLLPYSPKINTSIFALVYGIAEIAFWTGVFLVGEETYKKYKNTVDLFWDKFKEALKKERSLLTSGNRKNTVSTGTDIMNPAIAGSSMVKKPKSTKPKKKKTSKRKIQ